MFEVNTFNPHQTGALFSWLTVHRGPCSVLIHPNTGDAHKDHTELMSWMGRPWPLFDGLLRKADMRPGHGAVAERANAQAQTNDIDRDVDPATSTSTAPASSAPASSV
ncbi:DOPA-like domain-containing protein [Pholiota molesta]|nr:DOPA-like domain-containing protein [Pholiota molesta]